MSANESDTKIKINSILRKTTIAIFIIFTIIIAGFLIFRSVKEVITRDSGSVSKNQNSGIKSVNNYYTPTTVWGPSSSTDYIYQNFKVPFTDSCQVYTYENLFAENEFGSTLDVITQTKPNINTVFDDYVNSLNHIGGANPCISEDQIYAVNVTKKCLKDNSTHNKCYDNKGNLISQGASISYPNTCDIIKPCKGRIGSLSLNFKIEEKKINPQTKCVGVSQIRVPPAIYNSTELNLGYYKEDGIIIEDKTLKESDSYYPVTLINQNCNTRSARQKFLITNYKFGPETGGNNTFIPDDTGIYTSVIYKPLNSYLDMEFDNSGGIAEIKLETNGSGYQPGGKYQIIPEKSSESGSGGQVVIGVSGTNNEIGSFIISEIGKDYSRGLSCYIGGNGFSGTSAKVTITSVYQVNPQIVLRKITDNTPEFQDINWLFMPSIDLSKQRFPIQQRCNFVTPISLPKNENSIITAPLQQDTVFLESNFSGDDFPMNSNYCSNPITQYPETTFRNLTQFGKLSPFNFYNYHVETKEGNPPVIPNKNPYKLKENKTPRNFTQGEIFQDGTASILVEDFSKNILQFPSEYFKNTTGSVLSYFPVPDNTVVNKTSNPIYKLSDSGLIREVIVNPDSKLKTNKTIITGTYSGVSVLSATTSDGKPSTGTSASFDIQVNIKYDVTNIDLIPRLEIKEITNQGKNYDVGDILTINASDIGLSGNTNPTLIVTETELEPFIFTSIPMKAISDSKFEIDLKPFESTIEEYPIRDFTVVGTISESSSKLNFQVINDIVLDRGFGMKNGYLMWMMQLDINTGDFINTQYFNNLKTYLDSKKNTPNTLEQSFYQSNLLPDMVWISPDDVQTNQYDGDIPAPVSLTEDETQRIEFNFLQGSEMILNPSPQQLVYGNQVVISNLTLIDEFVALKINTPSEIENYFLRQKTGLNTDVVFLKSLQYENLKYSTVESNLIEEETNIILGKFIPYTSFTPMRREKISESERIRISFENIGRQNKISINNRYQLPTKTEPTLFNDNYTQIIPYGLDGVYTTNIKYNNESSSDNPYNNITQT